MKRTACSPASLRSSATLRAHASLLLLASLLAAFALLLPSCSYPGESAKQPAPTKVILDCDMGYMNDDTLCLSMLLQAEEEGLVEILGITLAGGNNFIDAPYVNYGETQFGSAQYTEDFLAAVNRSDIPYYRGTDFPSDLGRNDLPKLDDFYQKLDYLPSNDNWGAIHFFSAADPDLLCDSNEAADFLVSSVRNNPGEVVIISIAPTMNIANAVRQDAEFAANVRAIYCMGGALGDPCAMETIHSEQVEGIAGANVTPITEYNALYDPSAFETFLAAPFPHRYVLPGCCNVNIDESIAEKMMQNSSKNVIAALWAEHYAEYIQDYPYWDPLTAYAFLHPDAVTSSSVEYVAIDSNRNSETFGRTIGISAAEYEKLSPEQQSLYGKTEVIYEMDGFWDYTIDLLGR